VQEERLVRLNTGQINRIIQDAQDRHAATSRSGRALHIYYGTQVRSDPPTFLMFVNDPKLGHFTYLRYLENRIREEYPFTGTPIRLVHEGPPLTPGVDYVCMGTAANDFNGCYFVFLN
jgi:GTPase